MRTVTNVLLISIVFTFIGCTIKADPIVYGSDGCHFCSMTIVDRQHAAEIVTKKGKPFKFDAIECMVNHLKDVEISDVELFLVNDFQEPGELIDAKKATYLISKEIPSPMGEYLSAFTTRSEAESIASENKGKLYSWNELLTRFKVQ